MSSPLTTHVLDTSTGMPAAGLTVVLERQDKTGWTELAQKQTNADGRVGDLLLEGEFKPGLYCLKFATGEYYKARGQKSFFPQVKIFFEPADERHHHVPLLLSPYGYSTYRGS